MVIEPRVTSEAELVEAARHILCNVSDSLPATTDQINSVVDVVEMLDVLTQHVQVLTRDLLTFHADTKEN